ncbi:hypothetical protein [Mariprofundus ferrooxydans]|uniref:hypothetical protein n=1 Tax=Mariprofundus ferrooxydans TaxID=314344 RepID=UPI00128AE955|nr:hypothetical protein [Mariprofundus ferrooxydans]
MKLKYLLLSILLLSSLAGCEKDSVYRGFYEGMKDRERIVHPSSGPMHQEQPSYDEYKREREKSLKKDGDER